jgi:uncharacterized membrane protein
MKLYDFGRWVYAIAIAAIGVETIANAHSVGYQVGPKYPAIPTIPWVPAHPWVAYVFGVFWLLCAIGILNRSTSKIAAIALGAVLCLCSIVFVVPRNPNIMSGGWRTIVLEPIALGCLAWLMFVGDAPNWLGAAARALLAFCLIVFGIAHFQFLAFVAGLIPNWIPWHEFWTALFGVGFMAAGLSIATGYLRRWATLGIGLMYAIWVVTLHIPDTLGAYGKPEAIHNPDMWSSLFIAVAMCGGFLALSGLIAATTATRFGNLEGAA